MGGRPAIDLNEAKVKPATRLHDDYTLNIDDICGTSTSPDELTVVTCK
jgi:hypothetical protein